MFQPAVLEMTDGDGCELQGKQPKRSHCFPPMNREHRKMVHELAEAYGLESVSYDSEPKRNVVVTAHK